MTRQWVSDELAPVGDRVATWVASVLDGVGPDPAGLCGSVGLYVATPDSGAREAVAFWVAAQQTGLGLAAPGAFPWTLSNSVTGHISAKLGIRGPCSTWVGGDEALEEAGATARDDLTAGLVTLALVVGVRGDGPVAAGGTVRVTVTAEVLTTADAVWSDAPPTPAPAGVGVGAGEHRARAVR